MVLKQSLSQDTQGQHHGLGYCSIDEIATLKDIFCFEIGWQSHQYCSALVHGVGPVYLGCMIDDKYKQISIININSRIGE